MAAELDPHPRPGLDPGGPGRPRMVEWFWVVIVVVN
jgi:hypothetical protein